MKQRTDVGFSNVYIIGDCTENSCGFKVLLEYPQVRIGEELQLVSINNSFENIFY